MAESYNGWPASDDKAAIGVVSSTWFPGGVKAGDVATVLGYVATQLDARVEPIVAGWCWGYTYKANVNNPSQLSCHASGTAIDWLAPDHPNGSSGTFSDAQVGTIYAILDEVQGAVSWLEGYDEMHFEICVDAADLAQVAASLPGGGAVPPPVPDEPEDWWDAMSDDEKATLLADVAWIKTQLGALAGYGSDPGPYDYPLVIKTMGDRVYECQQALKPVPGYGEDTASYEYAQAFQTLCNRVYELTLK